MTPFMQEFLKLIDGVPGATERDQIKYWLTNSRPICLDDTVTEVLSKNLNEYPHTLEHNLDFIDLPFQYTWIEWSESSRSRDVENILVDRSRPSKVGVLLTPYEQSAGVTIGIVAWQFENGGVDYSHAVLSWSSDILSDHSSHARHRYSKVPKEVWMRIMSITASSIPEGFFDEISILIESDGIPRSEEEFHQEAHENSSAELLFILSVLLFLQTEQSKVQGIYNPDGEFQFYLCDYEPNDKKHLFKTPNGFYRSVAKKDISLSFYPVN